MLLHLTKLGSSRVLLAFCESFYLELINPYIYSFLKKSTNFKIPVPQIFDYEYHAQKKSLEET